MPEIPRRPPPRLTVHQLLLVSAAMRYHVGASHGCLSDRTGPILNPVHIQSSNSNLSAAKVGDSVTLSFTLNKPPLAPPAVRLLGAAVTPTGGPLTWSATATVAPGSLEGTVAFNVSVQDYAGNPASSSTVTDGSVVIIGTSVSRCVDGLLGHRSCQTARRRPFLLSMSFPTTATNPLPLLETR